MSRDRSGLLGKKKLRYIWGLAPNIAYFVTGSHKSELKWSCFRKSNYGQSAYHRRESGVCRRWYQWESSQNHLSVVLLYPGSPKRTKQRCSIFLLFIPTWKTTPLAASPSLTTNRNNNSSLRLTPNIFSASSGLENGNAVSGRVGHN